MLFRGHALAVAAIALFPSLYCVSAQRALGEYPQPQGHVQQHRDISRSDDCSPTATIAAGVVIGTTTHLPSATAHVNKFIGIPFAKSPPGRFDPPEPPERFDGPLAVQKEKPACMQQFFYPKAFRQLLKGLYDAPPVEQSEDCLYLNVFAPSTPPPPGGRVVMVFLFGGAFQIGGTALYDTTAFSAYQDVVTVVPNYRLNAFGFPDAPELPRNTRNLGLLDQRLALRWVQKNIHTFGGNPEKVTLFGQSSGAFSIDALISTHTKETAPFRAAIMESGQVSYIANLGYPPPRKSSWLALTAALNCTSPTSNLTCVRKAPAKTIKSIIEHQGLTFSATPDGETYPHNGAKARESRKNFAAVPVLMGSNNDEGTFFSYGSDDVHEFLEYFIGLTAPSLIPKIERAYKVKDAKTPAARNAIISRVRGLFAFHCGAALLGNVTAAAGVPTWRYIYNATFPNMSPLGGALGVYHGSEVQTLFQTYAGGPMQKVTKEPVGLLPYNRPPTAQQVALASYMSATWAAFAKNPHAGPGWNQVGTFGDKWVGVLGDGGSSGVTMKKQGDVDGECELLKPAFRALTGDVYGLGG